MSVLLTALPGITYAQSNLPPLAASAETTQLNEPGMQTVRALLVPRRDSTLSSQIAAQITRIAVDEGARFKKGQVLIEFACRESLAELQKARAELAASKQTHEANLELRKHSAISNLEVSVSASRMDKATADVSLMRARVSHCKVRAPFSGRIAKVIAKPYETVTQGQPLLEILDDSELKMQLYVPSKWLLWLQPGVPFRVRIDETGKTYPANVTSIGARVDPVSQTLAINAFIDGQHKELLAGMSGVARFTVPQ